MPKPTRSEYIARKKLWWAAKRSENAILKIHKHSKHHKKYPAPIQVRIEEKRALLDQRPNIIDPEKLQHESDVPMGINQTRPNNVYSTSRLLGSPFYFTVKLRPRNLGPFQAPTTNVERTIEKRLHLDEIRYKGNQFEIPTDNISNVEIIDYLLKEFIKSGYQGVITIKF